MNTRNLDPKRNNFMKGSSSKQNFNYHLLNICSSTSIQNTSIE